MLKAILFDDHEVCLDDASLIFGDNWREFNGLYSAYQPEIAEWIAERSEAWDQPVLFDVGASTGVCSLLPAILPRLKVLAFEPNQMLFQVLLVNVDLNAIRANVQARAVALGNRPHWATLTAPGNPGQYGLGLVGGTPSRAIMLPLARVAVMTLDSVRDIVPTIIKIDVEGAELEVLRGGYQLLERHHPDLVLEVDPRNTAQFGHKPEDVLNAVQSFGYRWDWLNKDNIIAWAT